MTLAPRRTVLVTRAAEQAAGTALRLRARGHGVVVAPLIRIERLSAQIDPGAQAILVTSRNGADALAAMPVPRETPVLAVGDATAMVLREAGFGAIRSANGDAEALAALAIATLDPAAGPVIHARGAEIRRSPLAALQRAGLATSETILYRTVPLTTLPDEAALCDTALVYSPGSARRLAGALSASQASLDIVAISNAALAPLRNAPFCRGTHAATHPSEDAMLAILDTLPDTRIS